MANDQPDMSAFDTEITNLDVIAIQFNEMYKSLQRGGFTPAEAIQLVGFIMAQNLASAPPYESEIGFDEEDGEDGFLDNDDGEDLV
jgi:hypothetical protein